MSALDNIAAILSALDAPREAFGYLASQVPPRIAAHAPDALDGVKRYASKVAKAENQKRGRDAGSPRALPGSTCTTVVRDYANHIGQGMEPAEAWRTVCAQCEYGAHGPDGRTPGQKSTAAQDFRDAMGLEE
jgi:hypothetical protein